MTETHIAEVEMLDAHDNVVEFGTCTVVLDPRGTQAHSFRSTSRPDEEWPLPPNHKFRLVIPS